MWLQGWAPGMATPARLQSRARGTRIVLWLVALTWRFCLLQFDDHLISPKEFVHLAGKSTLKDWKRAIRMNGIMLRWVPLFVLCSDSGGFFFLWITLVLEPLA